MREFTAGANDDGVRLSRFVLRVCRNLPNSVLYKSFRTGRVKVNGKKAAADQRLAAGDTVHLYLNDEYFPAAPHVKPGALAAGRIPVDAVYDDEAVSILRKPSGVLCHADGSGGANLLDAWTAALIRGGEYDPNKENAFTPAFCNRLDRNTEGLLIAAKTAAALRGMNALIKAGHVEKNYLCITAGRPPEGAHSAFLSRDKASKTVSVSPLEPPGTNAKLITTGVSVLEERGGFCLCEIHLYTGRTHQIRAHLAALGAPVLGDAKYGSTAANRRFSLRGQCLCAHQLLFSPGIPAESALARLAGMSFSCDCPTTLAVWNCIRQP